MMRFSLTARRAQDRTVAPFPRGLLFDLADQVRYH